MKFSEKIVFMRKKRKISQDRLAKKMGVSRQTIYKWEADLNTPEFNKIEKLAEILDISYDLLLDDSIDLNAYFNENINFEQAAKEVITDEKENQITVQDKQPERKDLLLIITVSIVTIILASVLIIIGITNRDKYSDNIDTDSDIFTDTSTDTSTDIIACNHNWTEWTVTDNGNCLIPQTLERVCNKCEKKETKDGDIVEEHDKNNRWFTKTPATCVDDEVEYTSCYKCHSEFYRQGALALGHTYENERCIRCQKSQYTEGIEYTIKNETAYVSGYTGNEEIISISPYYVSPDDNKKYPVTTVRGLSSENAKTLIIPEGVTEIRNINCPQLTEVKLPTTLRKIFDDTFISCVNITRVYIYDLKAWCQVSPVMAVMEGKTIFKYPYNMYLNDELLTEVHLTSDIYYVNSSVFENCSSIKRLTMDPDTKNIRSIGARAFHNTGLEYAQIDCTALEKDAFSFCYYLTTVDIYVRASVPYGSFNSCYHLCEIYAEHNGVSIGSQHDLGGVAEYAKIIHKSKDEPSAITKTEDGFVFGTVNDTVYLIMYVGSNPEIRLPRSFNGKNYTIAKNFAMGGSPNTRIKSVYIPKEIIYIEANALIANSVTTVYFEADKQQDTWEQSFVGNKYAYFGQKLDY